MKKALISLLILLICACTVFYFGWTSFAVPLGTYGVLTTKTGGISVDVVENGRFSWHWERLIPTNSRLALFSAEPRTVRISGSGTLPSGDLYAALAGGNPDFSWKIEGTVLAKINPARLPALVGEGIMDQAALDQWIDTRTNALTDSAMNRVLSLAVSGELSADGTLPDALTLAEQIRKNLTADSYGDFLSAETQITAFHLPDTDLYRLAKKTYLAYLDEKTREYAAAATLEAKSSVADQYTLDRFEKWGALLTKYPVLIDFLAVSNGNPEDALRRIRTSGQSAQ